ncbi:MAG: TspO/MBR family protein [Sphingomonadaceae bacterium]
MQRLASEGQLRASQIRWAVFLVPLLVLLGFLSGVVSNSGPDNPWFESLAKPNIYPAPFVLPIVWILLYILMGLALTLICAAWGARGRLFAILAFALQFMLMLAWSPVFFGMHQMTMALGIIIALDLAVIVTIFLFWRIRSTAGALLLPYLIWLLFATMLNWQFVQLNPDGDSFSGSSASQRLDF